jgi:hypothetical protein
MFEKDLIRIFLKFENCVNYMQKYNLQKNGWEKVVKEKDVVPKKPKRS